MGLGKILILLGVLLIGIGAFLSFGPKIPWLGKLPGDIHIQKEGSSFYFPIVTCLLISIILSVLLNLLGRK